MRVVAAWGAEAGCAARCAWLGDWVISVRPLLCLHALYAMSTLSPSRPHHPTPHAASTSSHYPTPLTIPCSPPPHLPHCHPTEGKAAGEALDDFIKAEKLPAFTEFSQETSQAIFGSGISHQVGARVVVCEGGGGR